MSFAFIEYTAYLQKEFFERLCMCKKITVILSVVSLSFCLLAKEKIRDLSSLQEQEGGSLLIVKSTNSTINKLN